MKKYRVICEFETTQIEFEQVAECITQVWAEGVGAMEGDVLTVIKVEVIE
jgi:hypothetical protein